MNTLLQRPHLCIGKHFALLEAQLLMTLHPRRSPGGSR
jgi:cytochrome P450